MALVEKANLAVLCEAAEKPNTGRWVLETPDTRCTLRWGQFYVA